MRACIAYRHPMLDLPPEVRERLAATLAARYRRFAIEPSSRTR